MAKNTSSNKFRMVDVDQYNEDNFKDDDSAVVQDKRGGLSSSEVEALLQKGNNVEALKAVLTSAPIGNKNQAEKDAALALVLRVLLSTKTNQVDECVKQLDNDQKDILMKYIYRGFENPNEGSSAQLLVWHEKTFASAGLGCIVRVLTDRKQV
jgi:actin related protein 2/3 complex subunit 5